MSAVVLDRITKSFDGSSVVSGIDLEIFQGEVIALLGPSGSGKTTMLRLIAGFETPDAGEIIIGGRKVTSLGALDRRCGMVFQHYALFPHLDVGANVGYGLEGIRRSREDHRSRIAEALALVDLAGYERRAVASLSGGQQQRVALARAIAPRPDVLLLDEPLSNLDPSLRERTRRELGELVRRIGMTTVLVTHEQDTAFDVADRVVLLLGGKLVQVGTASDLYHRPASPAVARFIGRVTELPGVASGGIVSAAGIDFGRHAVADGSVTVLLRPEGLEQSAGGAEARVIEVRFAGARDLVTAEVGGVAVELELRHGTVQPGDSIRLAPTGTGVTIAPGNPG